MSVHKLVLQVTVMCDTDTLDEAVAAYSSMTLEQIHEALSHGDDIGGDIKIASSETLTTRERIQEELLAIGNDGTFFDCNLVAAETAAAARAHTIEYRGYQIVPVNDPEETGDWAPVPEDQATFFEIYPPGRDDPKLDVEAYTLGTAKAAVDIELENA